MSTGRPAALTDAVTEALAGPVRSAWAEVLHAAVPDDADFFLLGGDSLAAIAISARVEESVRVRPGLRLIFDHPRFADYVRAVGEISGERP